MIPDGELLRSRVVTTLAPALTDVLNRRLDGYALVSARNTLLDADDEHGVITFEAGVPVLAYHSRTDRGGPPALEDIGSPPYRFELYELDADALELPHRTEELRVAPGAIAERLTDDSALADRTREVAGVREEPTTDEDTVEAFLEDDTAIEEIKRSARNEAVERAEAWALGDAVEE